MVRTAMQQVQLEARSEQTGHHAQRQHAVQRQNIAPRALHPHKSLTERIHAKPSAGTKKIASNGFCVSLVVIPV